MSKYLVINQIIEKPDGWSDSDVDIFVDNYLKLIDTYGKDYLKLSAKWEVKEEEEIIDETKSKKTT